MLAADRQLPVISSQSWLAVIAFHCTSVLFIIFSVYIASEISVMTNMVSVDVSNSDWQRFPAITMTKTPYNDQIMSTGHQSVGWLARVNVRSVGHASHWDDSDSPSAA